MIRITDVCEYLESVAPLHYQENYDNAGLLTGNPQDEVTGALICIDTTEKVIDEAIDLKYNLIIAHHPLIFTGLKQLTGKTWIERTVIKAIRHGIAIYAIHTNLDNIVPDGVNHMIARKLALLNLKILQPRPDLSESVTVGAGIVGDLKHGVNIYAFLDELKRVFGCKHIRHTELVWEQVSRIAVCGGSGSFLLPMAIAEGSDIFITADIKYHQFFDTENKIIIADIGHFESEQFTMELLMELLSDKFPNFAARITSVNTNPVKYY